MKYLKSRRPNNNSVFLHTLAVFLGSAKFTILESTTAPDLAMYSLRSVGVRRIFWSGVIKNISHLPHILPKRNVRKIREVFKYSVL